ncbi:MAG: hypothetical protein ABIJ42_00035, partial [Acidobacteriota bacterium]
SRSQYQSLPMACLNPPNKHAIFSQTVTYVLNLYCHLCLEPAPRRFRCGQDIGNLSVRLS